MSVSLAEEISVGVVRGVDRHIEIPINTPNDAVGEILKYAKQKLGPSAVNIVLLKLISVASVYLKNGSNCPMMFIAPKGDWKSRTSDIINEAVREGDIIQIKSKTWKRFMKDSQDVLNEKGACIFVDDITSISEHRTAREMNEIKEGFTALLTDGKYEYGNLALPYTIDVKAKGVSCVINMTPRTHKRMAQSGINSTFFDRFLRLKFSIPSTEKANWFRHQEKRIGLEYKGEKLKLRPFNVDISSRFRNEIMEIGNEMRAMGDDLYSDRIIGYLISVAKCHAYLTGRMKVARRDVDFIKNIVILMLTEALKDELAVMQAR